MEASHGRPLPRPTRDLPLDGLLEESVFLGPNSKSNPVAVLKRRIQVCTLRVTIGRRRIHPLVRG